MLILNVSEKYSLMTYLFSKRSDPAVKYPQEMTEVEVTTRRTVVWIQTQTPSNQDQDLKPINQWERRQLCRISLIAFRPYKTNLPAHRPIHISVLNQ